MHCIALFHLKFYKMMCLHNKNVICIFFYFDFQMLFFYILIPTIARTRNGTRTIFLKIVQHMHFSTRTRQ